MTLVRAIILGDGVGKVHGAEVELVARAADFDQLQRDHDALRAQFDQHRIDTGQDAHRLISEKMAALDKYDALLEQVRAARDGIHGGIAALDLAVLRSPLGNPAILCSKYADQLRALAALVKE